MIQKTQASLISEAELSASIKQVAEAYGYLHYHTYDSRRSNSGFWDHVLCGNGRLICIEAKTEDGQLTRGKWVGKGRRQTWLAGQDEWRDRLAEVKGPPEGFLWRPS